jgi:hypothetical protein
LGKENLDINHDLEDMVPHHQSQQMISLHIVFETEQSSEQQGSWDEIGEWQSLVLGGTFGYQPGVIARTKDEILETLRVHLPLSN